MKLSERQKQSLSTTIELIKVEWAVKYQYAFGHFFKINSKKEMTLDNIVRLIAEPLIGENEFLLWHRTYKKWQNGNYATVGGKRVVCYVMKGHESLSQLELWSLLWQSRNGGKEMSQDEIDAYEKDLRYLKEHLGLIKKREPRNKKTKPTINEAHEQYMFEKGLIMTPVGGKVKK